jgi:DNA-binding transcriptional LysR family regulator
VTHEEGWSVLPAMSVHSYLREKKLLKINLKTFIKDEVSVWWVRARKDMSETAKAATKWISEFKVD